MHRKAENNEMSREIIFEKSRCHKYVVKAWEFPVLVGRPHLLLSDGVIFFFLKFRNQNAEALKLLRSLLKVNITFRLIDK